jgi:hypothetical protein
MSEELRVPKRNVQVELLIPGGGARHVTVFLAEFAPTHSGPERLSDLLNAGDDFLPALDAATGVTTFIGRHTIAAARVAPEWEPADQPEGERHELEIVLTDGTAMRGSVSFAPTPGRTRVLDYLNEAQPFLRLAEPERVALIHKRHIARATPLR